jgi:hypothetical protein
MGKTAPVRSSESSARHADPEPEPGAAGTHCFSSHRTLSLNAPPNTTASVPGKSRSGYTRSPDPALAIAAGTAEECLAGAEAEEEEQEVEDEDSDHGIFSSSFTAAAGCGIVRGPLCDGLVSSRRSARADGIAPRPRFRSSLPLDVGFWGFAVFVRRGTGLSRNFVESDDARSRVTLHDPKHCGLRTR